jgi:acetylornithine deacetylase
MSLAGIPSVVFGPGDIARAHTCDEWVPLDEVASAAEVLFQLATRPD